MNFRAIATKLLLASLLLLPFQVGAATWTIHNLGASNIFQVDGSFSYNSSAGFYNTNINMYLRGSLSTTWTDEDFVGVNGNSVAWNDGETAWIQLTFSESLDSASGRVEIYTNNGASHSAPNWYENTVGQNGGVINFASGGYISEVPLPAAAWLFISAIGGLGFLQRSKQ